jgi:serine/tyrosine/threonine adenylyltransferase
MPAPLPPSDTPALDSGLPWHSRGYAALGEAFCAVQPPTPLAAPYWVGHSEQAAKLLGLQPETLLQPQWLSALSGNSPLAGTQSVATVYSGHQFGVWAGQLGDGRALLLGEALGHEVQIKGAGATPFSRRGDGRAVLRSSIREFLCSEAMHALGIATTRALCVTGSDDPVWRETRETAAVVTRLAPSFIRFGHFEHFAHTDQHGELRTLADYVIDRYLPECRYDARWGGNPYVALLAEVTRRTAELLAQWQAVGFCHGVMNTDNMSILGLTLDYGPFQFLDAYDPAHVCNHSDTQGRYAFAQQPHVAYWNLFCLGQALMPLIGKDSTPAIAALETYKTLFPQALERRMAAKLGFAPEALAALPAHTVRDLCEPLLQLMAQDGVDYTLLWRTLSHWAQDPHSATVPDLFVQRDAAHAWLQGYSALVANHPQLHSAQRMLHTNPRYVLRNHLGELAIRAAQNKDFTVLAQLLKVLERPYDEHPEHAAWAGLPPDWASSISISCSS